MSWRATISRAGGGGGGRFSLRGLYALHLWWQLQQQQQQPCCSQGSRLIPATGSRGVASIRVVVLLERERRFTEENSKRGAFAFAKMYLGGSFSPFCSLLRFRALLRICSL